MAKTKLISTKKHIYKTRHMEAGARYEANSIDAVVLVDLRKVARYDYEAPVREALPQPQVPVSEQVASAMALADLRAEAEGLGIKIDRRWAEGRLRTEIQTARAAQAAPPEPVPEPVAEPEPAAEPAVEPPAEEPPPPPADDEHAVPAETTTSGLFGGWRG